MHKLCLEALESRELPSATLLGGTLFVIVQGSGDRTVSVDSVGTQIQVNENGVLSSFAAAAVQSLFVRGSDQARNVIQNNTNVPGVLLGGSQDDTIFGGTGLNTIDAGAGANTTYALLGTNVINSKNARTDRVFTNFTAAVSADAGDVVVRFFGPGRTPGTPFIGLDPALNDGVLYITPSNNGSRVLLNPGPRVGSVLATFDLGDGNGQRTRLFTGVKAISYFGGSGDDVYQNNTTITEAAYGSAGNDVLVGGFGFSLMKGSGGNDTLVGRSRILNEIQGGPGSDVIVLLNQARQRDILHVDALDLVFGAGREDVILTP